MYLILNNLPEMSILFYKSNLTKCENNIDKNMVIVCACCSNQYSVIEYKDVCFNLKIVSQLFWEIINL